MKEALVRVRVDRRPGVGLACVEATDLFRKGFAANIKRRKAHEGTDCHSHAACGTWGPSLFPTRANDSRLC